MWPARVLYFRRTGLTNPRTLVMFAPPLMEFVFGFITPHIKHQWFRSNKQCSGQYSLRINYINCIHRVVLFSLFTKLTISPVIVVFFAICLNPLYIMSSPVATTSQITTRSGTYTSGKSERFLPQLLLS